MVPSRQKNKPLPISENDVEAEIITFLVNRGWIIRRQHSALARTLSGQPLRLGEHGQADWAAMRPIGADRVVEFLEVEVKRPGKKPEPAQREYLAKRHYQKISATWADSLPMFQAWYTAEGFD